MDRESPPGLFNRFFLLFVVVWEWVVLLNAQDPASTLR